jgi:hypothetical protein
MTSALNMFLWTYQFNGFLPILKYLPQWRLCKSLSENTGEEQEIDSPDRIVFEGTGDDGRSTAGDNEGHTRSEVSS